MHDEKWADEEWRKLMAERMQQIEDAFLDDDIETAFRHWVTFKRLYFSK